MPADFGRSKMLTRPAENVAFEGARLERRLSDAEDAVGIVMFGQAGAPLSHCRNLKNCCGSLG
jgi:hypothetical protein